MPTYYDEKSKTWFCKFYCTNYKGEKKQKKKRGFRLQREAKEWERSFLEQESNNLDMSFEKHILPYFKNKSMNNISPMDIRKWQNSIISNNNYSPAYLKKINGILNAIFNYASKYYDLKNNPCIKAGSIGRHKSKEMVIYTHEQMKLLLENVYDYTDYTIFSILFYTGIRKGELFALTKKDIDLDKGIINTNHIKELQKKMLLLHEKLQTV